MTEQQQTEFNQALDTLALALGSATITPEGKKEYWKSLHTHSIEAFMGALVHLRSNFKPRWRDHFPAPVDFSDAIEIFTARLEPETSRTYEAVKESYKKRGILIGDEAKRRLEDQILANAEARTGSRVEDRELYFNGPKGSRDPSKEK